MKGKKLTYSLPFASLKTVPKGSFAPKTIDVSVGISVSSFVVDSSVEGYDKTNSNLASYDFPSVSLTIYDLPLTIPVPALNPLK